MNTWAAIGITFAVFLVLIIVSLVFAIKKGGGTTSPQNGGPSIFASVLLVVSVAVIVGIFIMYFNGYFNKFKTSHDRMAIKYDYLVYHNPVDILPSVMPAPAAQTLTLSSNKAVAFQQLATQYKALFLDAVKALLMNKTRVEAALTNVSLTQDSKVLTNYDFSTPVVKFAYFTIQNQDVIAVNQQNAQILLNEVLDSLSKDKNVFTFIVNKGTPAQQNTHIYAVIATYTLFVKTYPKYVQQCLAEKCPYVQI